MFTHVAGEQLGRWTLLHPGESYRSPKGVVHRRWWCRCRCGTVKLVVVAMIRNGTTQSCGCLNREALLTALTTHGQAHAHKKTAEYNAWCYAKKRCTNPKTIGFKYYGGRGIRMCDEWLENFAAFYQHLGPKPSPEHSLDRIDVNGHYAPGNVRWATPQEQSKNRRPWKRRVAV